MIGWLKGQVLDKHQPGKLVIDVNGVGYDVETSLQTFFKLETNNDVIGLHIHTLVREDALLLYGFLLKEERTLFRSLIKINGIGPKLAMVILSSISPNELIHCIQQQRVERLAQLPGIGKKTAQRLVVELKDRLNALPNEFKDEMEAISTQVRPQDDATEALQALGYKRQEALNAVHKVNETGMTSERLIRDALQILAKSHV